jgi:hypothetical protein
MITGGLYHGCWGRLKPDNRINPSGMLQRRALMTARCVMAPVILEATGCAPLKASSHSQTEDNRKSALSTAKVLWHCLDKSMRASRFGRPNRYKRTNPARPIQVPQVQRRRSRQRPRTSAKRLGPAVAEAGQAYHPNKGCCRLQRRDGQYYSMRLARHLWANLRPWNVKGQSEVVPSRHLVTDFPNTLP